LKHAKFEKQTKTKRRKTMKNAAAMINDAAGALVSLLKGLIVASVFAGILFTLPGGWGSPVDGIVNLVNSFMSGGLGGLLALLVFASFIK
jgi:cytochrome bd-type quinol oxidase subunit 2